MSETKPSRLLLNLHLSSLTLLLLAVAGLSGGGGYLLNSKASTGGTPLALNKGLDLQLVELPATEKLQKNELSGLTKMVSLSSTLGESDELDSPDQKQLALKLNLGNGKTALLKLSNAQLLQLQQQNL